MARWRLAAAAIVVGSLAVGVFVLAGIGSPHVSAASRPTLSKRAVVSRLAAMPTTFVPGRGGVYAHGPGYGVTLDGAGARLVLDRGAGRRPALLAERLVGARPVNPRPEARLPGVINEYVGPRNSWRTGVPTFARVRYRSIYPGIDELLHGRAGRLEYDFVVAPGAEPGKIVERMTGAQSLRVDRVGRLVLRLHGGSVRESRPLAYQVVGRHRVPVVAGYRVQGRHVRFHLGRYDTSRPLVIDPVLSYASYIGGNENDNVRKVLVAGDGTLYIAGGTSSNDFPIGPGQLNKSDNDEDAFVTHLNGTGSTVLWTTFIGGKTHDSTHTTTSDEFEDLAQTGGGVVAVGYTQTTDFPDSGAFDARDYIGHCDTADTGDSGVIAFLSSTGAKGYVSCFGGNGDDAAEAVAARSFIVTGTGTVTNVLIGGKTASSDAWAGGTNGGYQITAHGGQDAFLIEAQFVPRGSSVGTCDQTQINNNPIPPCDYVDYGALLGGSSDEEALGVGYDSASSPSAYVSGQTDSSDFPHTLGSIAGGEDPFVAKFLGSKSELGGGLSYSLDYGTTGTDDGGPLAVTSAGDVYTVGDTNSSNLPNADATGNLLRGGGVDGFIAHVNPSGSVLSTTYVGGSGNDTLSDIAIQKGPNGVAEYVAGTSNSSDLTSHDAPTGQSCNGSPQALVVKHMEGQSPPGLVIACVGAAAKTANANGVAVAPDGGIWVAGNTTGGFPFVNGLQSALNPGAQNTQDGFLAELTPALPTITGGPTGVVSTTSPQFTFSSPESDLTFACTVPDGTNHLVAGATSSSQCPTPGVASYSGLAEGDHTFEVSAVDAFGTTSAPASRTFTVDTTAPDPFDLVSPAAGDQVHATQPVFSWNQTQDLHGVSYAVIVDGSPIQTTDPNCAGGVCAAQSKPSIPNGDHTWKVVASDGATPPNTRDSTSTRPFSVVDPVQARFTIAPNPALVGHAVTFDGSSSNDATHTITRYEWDLDGNGSYETDSGSNPVTTKSYPTATIVAVGLRVTVSTGGTGTSTKQLTVNDPSAAAKQIGVSIDNGAQYTNDQHVTLAIVSPAAATQLLISNDGGFADALPQAVAKEVPWTLDSAGPERLPKTVYLRFLTGPFASPNYTDDIILDTRPPVVQSATIESAPTGATAAALRPWKVKVKAKDDNSGVGKVQVAVNKRKPGKLVKYAKTVKVKLASRPKFIRARDRAGNFSPWKKLR